MRLRALLALTLLAATTVAQAQTRRPMTFADLQAFKRISDPQISPSGKWVLFSVTDVSLEKNTKTNHLWVVPIAGGKEVQLTTGSGETNGRFSPDGKSVMYSSAETGSSQIWLAPWDDAAGTMAAGHQVTALETEADGAIWAPDSKHILFTSDVYPECESKAPMGTQRNEEEANCNALKDTIAAKSPVKALIFTELLYRHWTTYQGPKRSHIFYASVEGTHEAPTDLTPASVIGDHVAPTFFVGGAQNYTISPDGKEIAYVVNLDKVPAESTNNDIFTLQVGAEPSTAKKVSTSPGSDDSPEYSPDGKWLAWRSQARNGFESDLFKLVAMKRSSGKTKDVIPSWDNWVDEFTWAPDSESIVFESPLAGEEPIYDVRVLDDDALPAGMTYDPKSITVVQHTLQGEYGSPQLSVHFSTAKDGRKIPEVTLVATKILVDSPASIISLALGRHTAFDVPHDPSRLQVVKPIQVPEMQLTRSNDALLDALDRSKLESFWFTGAANTKVEGFIIRPPNFDPAKKYPLKFVMHGGPQTAWGDSWSYRWNWELLAANGYVVVGINRRGSTGYGQKFVDEVSGDWGGKAFTDLMNGLDYAEKTYLFIDKNRECALGASYGGFMADWVLTHTNRFKCIVTHDGMYNPQSAFGTTEELWFNEWEFRPMGGPSSTAASSRSKVGSQDARGDVVEQTHPAHPWDFTDRPAAEDPFRKWSPMMYIKNAKTPTLVIHSQKDYRLDVSEGFQLFTALQLLHVPSKMLYFPDEGHWVLKPQNSQLWYQTVNDWCDQWTHTNAYAEEKK